MYKIMITCRNRLAITQKCIESIVKHSKEEFHIYIYDNLTSYRIDEHFSYFNELYKSGIIKQVTFNTPSSTFFAFSKAVSSNMFGLQHMQDPKKNEFSFLVLMDNDMIVTPEWDEKIKRVWKIVNKTNLNHIKIISQCPGGIKPKIPLDLGTTDISAVTGKLGGSGLWTTRSNFFEDVGLLDLRSLVGHNKKHDQMYWHLMDKKSGGKNYILGIQTKLAYHCGAICGSVCNQLTKIKDKKEALKRIRFQESDENISKMDFDSFYKFIESRRDIVKGW